VLRGAAGADFELRVDVADGISDKADLPVVVFSHGDGVAPDDYDPLIQHWVTAGLVVLRPHHIRVPGDARHWLQRVEEMHAAADSLGCVEAAIPRLAGRLNRTNLRVAGHSFGAHTAAILLGARPKLADRTLAHPLVTSGVLLAPPGNGDRASMTPEWLQRMPHLDMDWRHLTQRTLLAVGTADRTPISHRGWRWHADAVKDSAANIKLVVLPGADHYLGGIAIGRGVVQDPVFRELAALTCEMLCVERVADHTRAAVSDVYI
jgi:predicted dienelactone hydrolase